MGSGFRPATYEEWQVGDRVTVRLLLESGTIFGW
jgi:hypothetical protein